MMVTTVTTVLDKQCRKIGDDRSRYSLIWFLQPIPKVMEILGQTREHSFPIEQLTRLELQHSIDADPVKVHRPALNRESSTGHVITVN
jgi:hypothetical protein